MERLNERTDQLADLIVRGERVAQRRQLPIQYGDDPRLGGVKHQVAQPEIPMTKRHLPVIRWLMGVQPVNHLFDGRDRTRGGGAVLPVPAGDLTLEIVAGLAVVAESGSLEVNGGDRHKDVGHLLINTAALTVVGSIFQDSIPVDSAVEKLHKVELCTRNI